MSKSNELREMSDNLAHALLGRATDAALAVFTTRRIETIFLADQPRWLEYCLRHRLIDLNKPTTGGPITIQFSVPPSALDKVTLPDVEFHRITDEPRDDS